jgi:hypothetical protein
MNKPVIKIVLSLLIVSWLGCPALGNDGLALMKVEHGARGAGMGAAFVSIIDDPNGVVYNPAAFAHLVGFTASFGHTAYWENVRLESGFFATSLSSRTFLHGGIRFAVVDEIEQRLLPTEEPESYFDAHDISFKAGLAYRISDKVTAGVSSGWFVEKIEAWRGSAFSVDLGLLVSLTDKVNLGGSITNLGGDFSLSKSGMEGSREISLPVSYTAGASYLYDRFLGAADLVILDDEAHLHLGLEATVHRLLILRGGYMFNYDSKNITAGASFTKRNISVDYAFVPYTNNLGTSHLFNLTLRF